MEMEADGEDHDCPAFVAIHFETDSPVAFEQVIFDRGRLQGLLNLN